MNRPGIAEGNWRWRVRKGELASSAPAEGRLRELTSTYGRRPRENPR